MDIKTNKKEGSLIKQIASGIAISLGCTAINEIIKLVRTSQCSIVDISEWDSSYNSVNKHLRKMNEDAYDKHREPAINKDYYEITSGMSYFIKLKNNNCIKIDSYKPEKKFGYSEKHLRLSFYGNDRHKNRAKFISDVAKVSDERHIPIKYMNGECEITHSVITHKFDNLIMKDEVKSSIIDGLNSWNDSKDWYDKYDMIHKIGVFLYGKAGTGKSSVAKAISTMFDNSPIITIDADNVMKSINEVIKARRKYSGVIIVLIEDFDMYFKSREELENVELDVSMKKRKDSNQNAIFQLLDGVYSTEDTIYIATTNYKDRIDKALIRHGRFDIQKELEFFEYEEALKCVEKFGYGEELLNRFNIEYPIQPALLQSKIMEYRYCNDIK